MGLVLMPSPAAGAEPVASVAITLTSLTPELPTQDDEITVTGRNQLTMPDAEGNLQTETGRYVTVWRREPDGTWRCAIDIWNAGP